MPLGKERQIVSWLRVELDHRVGDLFRVQLELTGSVVGAGFSSRGAQLFLSS